MANVNKAILIGRLGKDPDSRALPDGTAVTIFNLATSRSWKDQQGTRHEKTQWHRVVCYAKLGELAAQYLHKGSKVYVEGEIQHREWTDSNNQKQRVTEVVLDQWAGKMQFLDPKDNQQNGYQQPAQQPSYQQPQQQQQQQQQQAVRQQPAHTRQAPQQQGGFDQFDDDIPF